TILRDYGWYYDNGWLHDSIHWDCYNDSNYGCSNIYFVILVKNGKGRLLKFTEGTDEKTEIWAGVLSNEEDLKQLIEFINSQYE
ncbi:MAG: hypothetical protein OQJ89_05270, partial [Kangiellaceae bacterium]|nr:hypothetical protein [Kangiellaceae bacterium]